MGIPPFKSADALRFPLERRGATVTVTTTVDGQAPVYGDVVVVCDPLFASVVGAACGGPAEERWLEATPELPGLAAGRRIDAGSRRVITIYEVVTAP